MYQYSAAFTANLALLSGCMFLSLVSPSIPTLTAGHYIYRARGEEDLVFYHYLPVISAVAGSLLVGIFGNFLGRKTFILISTIPFATAWILYEYCDYFEDVQIVLRIASACEGLADGIAITMIPIYVSEISSSHCRGKLLMFTCLTNIYGILSIKIIERYLEDLMFYIGISVIILGVITFVWIPESPYYYFLKQNEDDGVDSLKKFKRKNDVAEETKHILEELEDLRTHCSITFIDLFIWETNRKALFVTLFLQVLQQTSGESLISTYWAEIFAKYELDDDEYLVSMIFISTRLIFSTLSFFMMDSVGRKLLLIISTVGTAVSLLISGIFLCISEHTDISEYDIVKTVCLCAFQISFSIGLQNLPLLMAVEVFPTNIKPTGLCVFEILRYPIIIAITEFVLAPWNSGTFPKYVPFLMFGVANIFGILGIVWFVPETNKKTLEEIQKDLRGEGYFRNRIFEFGNLILVERSHNMQ